MSPTTTDGLPPVIARASGEWIWFMSHCKPDRLSVPGAGVPVVVAGGIRKRGIVLIEHDVGLHRADGGARHGHRQNEDRCNSEPSHF